MEIRFNFARLKYKQNPPPSSAVVNVSPSDKIFLASLAAVAFPLSGSRLY